MAFLSLKDKNEDSHYYDENKEIIDADNDKIIKKGTQDEKLNEILIELKALRMALIEHDRHLIAVNNNMLNRFNEMMSRRKELPKSKIAEAEAAINSAKTRKEAVEKLKSIGISQATAYRYTKHFKPKTEPEKTDV